MSNYAAHTLYAKEIIGSRIIDQYNNDIGCITELVLDRFSGCINYIILKTETLATKENKLFALPWKNLVQHQAKVFKLNITDTQLRSLDELDKQKLPDLTDVVANKDIASDKKTPGSEILEPGVNNKDQLKSMMTNQPQQIQQEIFFHTDDRGENFNPSEQEAYPGIQLHKPHIVPDRPYAQNSEIKKKNEG